MTGAAFATIADFNTALIRKTLQGIVAVADPSADALTAANLFGAGGLLPLPDGWNQLGKISDDGAQFARAVDVATVTSWGDQEPSRQDVKSDVTTLAITCNELRGVTLGLYFGIDISTVTADHTTGAITISKPSTAQQPRNRVAVIGVDTTDPGEVVMVRQLPFAAITDFADQQWNSSADAASPVFGFTFTGFKDPVLNTSDQFFAGGPGWVALLDDMNITQAGA